MSPSSAIRWLAAIAAGLVLVVAVTTPAPAQTHAVVQTHA
jgi:hypothetical protein